MVDVNTVLIVDDQAVNRRILLDLLENEYDLLFAKNGLEALSQIEKNQGKLAAVLLDIIMPELDGFGVLKAISRRREWESIPVIVMTQDDGKESEVQALSMGAMDFIRKPYNPEILRHKLYNIVSFRKTASMMRLLTIDSLTGVYSKEAFFHKVRTKLEENPDMAYDMISVDIEQFKLINDVFGFKAGDELLIYVAELLLDASAKIDGVCGRIAGDHFALLCPRKNGLRDRLAAELCTVITKYPLSMKIHVKIGVFEIEDRSIAVSGMCDRALMATTSRKYGEFYALYDDSIREKMLREQHITHGMQAALAEGQFQVYFQPKYLLKTEEVAGAEALVRWIQPPGSDKNHADIMPSEFIPLFEKNGFITELDYYVWRTVCAYLADRISRRLPCVPISVNVSRRDIYNEKLPDILQRLVAQYGIDKKLLHLEITETAYTEMPEQLIHVVSRIKEAGFIVEMDDFGSGYSSLNMLSEMPLDVLKLDMKFIQNEIKLRESGQDQQHSILNFIIGLGKWMNLEVVAEGVETKEQAEILKGMHCDYAQGFYYAKPMCAEDFTRLLDESQLLGPERKYDRQHLAEGLEELLSREEKKGILIVDDTKLNREIFRDFFTEQYRIVEAENGREALDHLRRHPEDICVILLNIVMPVMDGFEFMKKLKTSRKLKEIPVIVTSQTDRQEEARLVELGVTDFMLRPFRKEVARCRVRNTLAESRLEKLIKNVRQQEECEGNRS